MREWLKPYNGRKPRDQQEADHKPGGINRVKKT